MGSLDKDTIVKIAAGFAVIVAAIFAATLGAYGQLALERYRGRQAVQKEKAGQRLKLYQPLLRFCYDLDRRLGHILTKLDSDWLRATYLDRIKAREGFAVNPAATGYFIISSLYMLACFFGWAEAIKRSGDASKAFKERSSIRKWLARGRRRIQKRVGLNRDQSIFRFDPDISTVSKLFQYEELFRSYMTSRPLVEPRDACKLHKHLQYAIGELMLEQESDGWRCKSFREFYEAYVGDERFRYWFSKLEELLVDLSDFTPGKDLEAQVQLKNDIRPLRLLAIRYWCRILMRNLSNELDIETPSPDEALQGVSGALGSSITDVKIDKLESYLLGIRLSNG
jgi:hypothetical protein